MSEKRKGDAVVVCSGNAGRVVVFVRNCFSFLGVFGRFFLGDDDDGFLR
jgi:hypothetical protein